MYSHLFGMLAVGLAEDLLILVRLDAACLIDISGSSFRYSFSGYASQAAEAPRSANAESGRKLNAA
jgi:hypothetical protein